MLCFLSYGCVFLWFEEVFLYDLIENFVYAIDLGFFSPSLPVIQRYCFVFLFVLFCFLHDPTFLVYFFPMLYFFVFLLLLLFLLIWFRISLLSPRPNILSFAWFILLIKLSFEFSSWALGIFSSTLMSALVLFRVSVSDWIPLSALSGHCYYRQPVFAVSCVTLRHSTFSLLKLFLLASPELFLCISFKFFEEVYDESSKFIEVIVVGEHV